MKYRSIIIAGLLITLFSSCLHEQPAPISSFFSIEVGGGQNLSYGCSTEE